MIDTGYLLAIIYILFYALIGITIIALSSIIALVVLLCKSKQTKKTDTSVTRQSLMCQNTISEVNHVCGFSISCDYHTQII